VPGPIDRADVGFLLLHGAELGGWIWDRVVPLLRHRAVAADLPGRGRRPVSGRHVTIDRAVDAIIEDIGRLRAERVILVAHSFSGILAPSVVARLGDRAAGVVFLGASVPDAGRAWVHDLPLPQRALLRALSRVRPDGVRSPAKQNATALCHDLDAEATEAVLTQRVPEPPQLLLGAVGDAELPAELARHYVRLTEDRSMSVADQDRHLARLGTDVQVHDLASGHLPMLSRPDELAALLDAIAGDR
jgi:pimeloyl-ACP methyl ester carboxylesterase